MLQAGAVQLLCLTASSGVPLFCRGASKQLPFSVIGSLNGVHMFAGGQGVQLFNCDTDRGGRVLWKVFHDSVMLIAVTGQRSDACGNLQLRRLLDNVWNCMVLVLGLEELTNVRNVERLKRELRSCYQLIDTFLDVGKDWMGDLTHCVECLLPAQPAVLQDTLNAFAQAAESDFGCLLVHGKMVVATDKWWRLAPQEVVLLAALVRTLGGSACCDCPIFLPQGSPTVPHRLLRFQLLPGVNVCMLCGPTPTLQSVEGELVVRFWRPLVDMLHGCQALHQRCFPGSVGLHRDVLALLLINRESSRAVSSVHPAPSAPGAPSPIRRWELLRLLFTFATTRYFSQTEAPQKGEQLPPPEEFAPGFSDQPQQCYLVTDECKFFALQTPQHQLYILTAVSVPTFALRPLATRTLSTLTDSTGF
ncbi:protein fuzzy homolog [Paramormyrops kingsleyae]|uniref:protein fuzzy homolog n=1 Tax=Paramormyrops kingsleyae TaxID=1676925 RepID=UPI003B96B25D